MKDSPELGGLSVGTTGRGEEIKPSIWNALPNFVPLAISAAMLGMVEREMNARKGSPLKKLSTLAGWLSGADALFCRLFGTFVLMRGIHHVKLVVSGDRIKQIKGYVIFLLCSWSQDGLSAG